MKHTGTPLGGGGNTTWVGFVLEFRDTEFCSLGSIWRALVEDPPVVLRSTSLGPNAAKAERFQEPSP